MTYQTVYYQMSTRQMAHLDIPIGYAHEDTRSRGFITPKTLEKSKGLGMAIGIVAGVMTAGVGYGVMAAAGGLASMSAGALAGGAMMAGGVMSAVGAATGNKKLSQYGGYLSLAGGAYAAFTTPTGAFTTGKDSLLSAGTQEAMTKVSSAFSSSASAASSAASGSSAASSSVAAANGVDTVGAASTISQGGVEAGSTAATLGQSSAPAVSESVLKGANTLNGTTMSIGDPSTYTGISSGAQSAAGAVGTPMATGGSPLSASIPASQLASTGGQSGGLIADAWKGLTNMSSGSGMMAGQLLNGMAQGGATEELAKQQALQTSLVAQKYANDQAELQRQIKNMNSAGVIYYDPNDLNAQKIVAAAQAAGVQPRTLQVNQSAQVKNPMNAFQGAQA